ncbi:hypothetical protein EDC01DRAFT_733278 [Geopyxis carbonaria]|nr:hypothetical protein EDC01DRAFT_733278 [Geopyxis carbonaria]
MPATASQSPPPTPTPSSSSASSTTGDTEATTITSTIEATESSPLLAKHAAVPAPRRRTTLGIFLLLLSQLAVSLLNLLARYLSTRTPATPTFQILFLRMSLTLLLSLLWLLSFRIPILAPWHLQPLLLLRAAGSFTAVFGLYTALRSMPLPNVTLIGFLAPTLIALAAHLDPALREPFRTPDALAGLVALAGIALLLHPSTAAPAPPAAVAAALSSVAGIAATYIAVRRLRARVHPLVSTLYFAALTTAVAIAPGTGSWVAPKDWRDVAMWAALGAAGFVQQFAMTKGLQWVPAGPAAALVYTQIAWAVAFEGFVWGRWPVGVEVLGGVIVLGAAAGAGGWKWWAARRGREDRGRGGV